MNAASANPVGRPKGFDEAEVLGRAMEVFWRQGYDGTSMADLLSATGLHKGSLYHAFGDKHSLFVRALRSYLVDMQQHVGRIISQADTAFAGLREALFYVADLACSGGKSHSGCLALDALVEKAPHDPEIMQVLAQHEAMRFQAVTRAVTGAQAEGRLRGDWPPERLGSLILTLMAGIGVLAKGSLGAAQARGMVDDLLASLA